MEDLSKRLKTMGLVFLGLALFFSLSAFYFPEAAEYSFALTKKQKEPFYMISGVFVAMGFFCLSRRG